TASMKACRPPVSGASRDSKKIRPSAASAWLLVAETAYDTSPTYKVAMHEYLMAPASDVTGFILVSTVLIAWQLYSRRHEALDCASGRQTPTCRLMQFHSESRGSRLGPQGPRRSRAGLAGGLDKSAVIQSIRQPERTYP